MANILEQHGAQPQKQPLFVPLFIDRAFTGLYTHRNVLHDPSDLATARFYGGRPDALWQGSNIELTNRLTLQRRPGLSAFSTVTWPTAPLRAFSFQLINGTIQVVVDTGSTGALALTAAANASAGTTAYTGTITGGGSNAYVGMLFTVAGFTNLANNGAFVCTASSTTTLTLANASGIAETHAGTAISAGAVYVDNQNSTKTLLFAKSAGAGQTYFVAVAGVLYMGDGVDTRKYTPLNTNGTVWNWGGIAPSVQPNVVIIPSAAAATTWHANTVWSTMGLIYDAGTNTTQQLQSVNATTTNATDFGTSGNGQPNWNQTPGSTTADNTITWKNSGPIVLWSANTLYNNATVGGTAANPCIIYDPVTKACYINANSQGYSGTTVPHFIPGAGQSVIDNQVKWFYIGTPGIPGTWQPTHSYPNLGSVINNDATCSIVEPIGLQSGLPTNQTVYWQTSGGGTSGTSGTSPVWQTTAGLRTGGDGDLIWMSLGSDQWSSTTQVSGWSTNGTIFTAILDSNGNFQVCTTTGITGGSAPTWGTGYGTKTTDGSAVWTCVGTAMTWAANTQWFHPLPGFSPPSSSSPYGGASLVDSNGNEEFIVNSGLGGAVQPTWPAIGSYVADGGTSLTLSVVTVSGVTTTYTVTAGGPPVVGRSYVVSGFTNAVNNGIVICTSIAGGNLVVKTGQQINETHAGAAKTGAIWYDLTIATTNSLSWTKGYIYAYSYKARTLTDYYSVAVNGALPIPPGLTQALPAPTGSETGLITTASPVFTIIGSNSGAVNTITGIGSTDTQFDTIVIWRTADGGSSAQMFELTEIPMPPPVGGIGQPWSFKDYLPDTPTSLYPGLNPLIPAPIDGTNNPPPSTFLPMAYNFERIWGANGQNAQFSGGPDVLTGNPNEAFSAIDSLPFLANVVRLVKTPLGLITFLTDSIELIGGGPATSSFYSVTLAPGTGLSSYNMLDQFAGEIYFFSSDNRLVLMNPYLNMSNAGFPVGDQLANYPASGVSDTTWNPATGYLAILQNGTDNCLILADGSTGWYRLNPHQVPGGYSGVEPVWSPYATITGGCKMVQTVETAPGIRKLLVGGTGNNEQILYRNQSVFTDNGTQYDAWFTMGSIGLVHAGQLAVLKFIEMDMSGVSYTPTVSYLLDELSGTFTSFTANPVFDPPSLYGTTIIPKTYSPNRYYFSGTNNLARCRHLQIKVDFGTTPNGDEIYNMTIFGRLFVEA